MNNWLKVFKFKTKKVVSNILWSATANPLHSTHLHLKYLKQLQLINYSSKYQFLYILSSKKNILH